MNKYQGLITSYHYDKPKYIETIGLSTAPLDATRTVIDGFISDYDLDAAAGTQLDAVGLWIGIGRTISTPITGVYFSLDTDNLGLDQGSWQGQYDDGGFTALDDETYRTILRAKIAANNWDGSMSTLVDVYQQVFPDHSTTVGVVDNLNMTMSVYLMGHPVPAVMQSIISLGYLDVKPAGVRIDFTMTPVDGAIFGFDVNNQLISGFDTGTWAVNLGAFNG